MRTSSFSLYSPPLKCLDALSEIISLLYFYARLPTHVVLGRVVSPLANHSIKSKENRGAPTQSEVCRGEMLDSVPTAHGTNQTIK